MLGLGASRFPRVSFKTERPFIIGTVVTFGLITWLHNKIYQDGKTGLELLLVDHLLINGVYVVKPTGMVKSFLHGAAAHPPPLSLCRS